MPHDISTTNIRAHFAKIAIPKSLQLNPWMFIADLPMHIETQIKHLESPSARQRDLAILDLIRVAEKLNHPFPIE